MRGLVYPKSRIAISVNLTISLLAIWLPALLGSYRPVALENTLGKILEKIVAERI